ncbi:hypothetical protein D3C81_1904660 [compost metagenome]
MVRNITQRFLAFTQADAALRYVFTQRDLVETIAGLTHAAAAEQLHKVTWLCVVISHCQCGIA